MTMLLFALVPLIGLTFILLIGRWRRTSAGPVDAPAPGSPESPLFGTPKTPPVNTTARSRRTRARSKSETTSIQ